MTSSAKLLPCPALPCPVCALPFHGTCSAVIEFGGGLIKKIRKIKTTTKKKMKKNDRFESCAQ